MFEGAPTLVITPKAEWKSTFQDQSRLNMEIILGDRLDPSHSTEQVSLSSLLQWEALRVQSHDSQSRFVHENQVLKHGVCNISDGYI